jgi:hypothetical protein
VLVLVTPPIAEEKAPFQNTSWSWAPTGRETNICCVGERQQKFNRPTEQYKAKVAPYLRRLVGGFPPLRPAFEPRSGRVVFVVD